MHYTDITEYEANDCGLWGRKLINSEQSCFINMSRHIIEYKTIEDNSFHTQTDIQTHKPGMEMNSETSVLARNGPQVKHMKSWWLGGMLLNLIMTAHCISIINKLIFFFTL